MELCQIGWIETCYKEKFGAPRQSGVVPEAWGIIRFCDGFRDPNLLRGLDGFSHLWLIFGFHRAAAAKHKALVRPPRLGGNEKLGVFATRSPFRPNPLGLSVVEIDKIITSDKAGNGLEIHVRGVDLVDRTPIYDIKPYIPYCDAVADASSGFASGRPEDLEVKWDVKIPADLDSKLKNLIEQTLATDPRPAYHDEDNREYGCLINGYNVRWMVAEGVVKILGCVGV